MKERSKVVLHLAIENETLVVTQNTNDSESEGEEISTSSLKTSMDNACNQKVSYVSHKTGKRGLKSESAQLKPALLPICRCKRKCLKKFSEPRTREIYESFWQVVGTSEEMQWIMEHVQKSDRGRWKRKRNQETRNYFMTDERGRNLQVCARYFQRVLGFTDASLLEPLIGNIDHFHAYPLHSKAFMDAHQTDSVSFHNSPRSNDTDINHRGFCSRAQTPDGYVRGMDIFSSINRSLIQDTSKHTHINDSSGEGCENDWAEDRLMKLLSSEAPSNGSCKKGIKKDICIEHVNSKGSGEGHERNSVANNRIMRLINHVNCKKDITEKNINNEDTNVVDHNNSVAKDSIIKHISIDSSMGEHSDVDIGDHSNGSNLKNVGNVCTNKYGGTGINKDNSSLREYLEQHFRQFKGADSITKSRDRPVEKLHNGFKSSYPDSAVGYEQFQVICDQVSSGDLASVDRGGVGMVNLASQSEIITRRMGSALVGGDKLESRIPENRRRSTRTTRMRSSLVGGDKLESRIIENRRRSTRTTRMRSSLVGGDKFESRIPENRQRSTRTTRMRSSLVGGDKFESRIPENRRRSTRTTSIKGSMAEEGISAQTGVEASDAFNSRPTDGLISDEQNYLICSQRKLKLNSKPKHPENQSLDKSESSVGPTFVKSCQDNMSLDKSESSVGLTFVKCCQDNNIFHSNKQEVNNISPQLGQSALTSRHCSRNKDGGGACKKYNISVGTKKKKTNKKTPKVNNVKIMNPNELALEIEQTSKKLCKLSILKKKNKHPLLPACNCSRRRCIENIPEERRRTIHDQFWDLSSYKDRQMWLMKFVLKRERKNKVLSLFPQRKNESKRYFLLDDKNVVIEVCRLFFIHTLGFKWDSIVDAAVRSKISSDIVGPSSRQVKNLPRQLPDYIIDSVTEYLISVRNSCTMASKVAVDSDVTRMLDVSQANDGSHRIFSCDDQTAGLAKPKVKELFKCWRIKYKNCKFNLGYHSFRRIFQSVIDPVPAGQVEVTEYNQNMKTMEVYSAACSDVDYSEISCNQPGNTEPQKTGTVGFSEDEPNGWKPLTDLRVSNCTESVLHSHLTISTTNGSNNPMMNRKSICQEDQCFDMENSRGLEEELANDDESCILDVGSGIFKYADADTNIGLCSDQIKYKKRQSLSMRNDRNNYPVLPPCKCRKRKCAEKFSASQRQEINTIFWDLGSYNERKQWILEHIKRADIKRRIVFSEGTPRKLESRWYYLPGADGNKVDVCKCFFLRTLGYRWDSVIDTIGKTTPKGVEQAAPDRRGRKPPPHKITDEAVASMAVYVENICNTYQPVGLQRSQDSTQILKPNPHGQIPYGLTMKQLFEDYKYKHPNHKFGYESFRKVFRRVHGEFVASLPAGVDSKEELKNMHSKMIDSGDKDYSVKKDNPVGHSFLAKEDYISDANYSTRKGYPAGRDSSAEKDDLMGKDCSRRKDYVIGKNCSAPEKYSVGKDCQESVQEGCSNSFGSKKSQFAPALVSYSETNLQTSPSPLPPLQPTPCTCPQTSHQHQSGSGALEHNSCLYQSRGCLSHPLQHPPVIQIPDRIEPSLTDHYNSADINSSMMYQHNVYCPPTDVSGHFTHTADHLGHSNGVNPHTYIDSATGGTQNQFPAYLGPNSEPLQYHMASILHHIAGSSRFCSYTDSSQTTFHEPSEKYNLAFKQGFQRNMKSFNTPQSSYSDHPQSASSQVWGPSQNYPVQYSVEQDSTATTFSAYSDENDNNFAQDHQQTSTAIFLPGFNHNFPNKKEFALKDTTMIKKGRSEEKKDKKEIKIKPKSLRNYGEHYPMLATCNCKKKRCNEKFSEEARQKLHDMFWDLADYNERKQWMLQHIKRQDCKRRRIDQLESFRKLESRWYFFPDEEGNQQEVCKDFFLRTLGYKWDSVIDTIRRTTPKGETTTPPDQRGRKAPGHKLSSAVLRSVVQYIKSMQQISQPLSEYDKNVEDSNFETSSENITDRSGGEIAVPYGLTVKDLYDDYKAKHVGHKIGYESFRRIFRTLSKSEEIVFDDKSSEDFLCLNSDKILNV